MIKIKLTEEEHKLLLGVLNNTNFSFQGQNIETDATKFIELIKKVKESKEEK